MPALPACAASMEAFMASRLVELAIWLITFIMSRIAPTLPDMRTMASSSPERRCSPSSAVSRRSARLLRRVLAESATTAIELTIVFTEAADSSCADTSVSM